MGSGGLPDRRLKRAPLRRNGEYVGVLAATETTRNLSRYLDDLSVPHDAVAFILVGPEDVLTYPNLEAQRTRRGGIDAPSRNAYAS